MRKKYRIMPLKWQRRDTSTTNQLNTKRLKREVPVADKKDDKKKAPPVQEKPNVENPPKK